MNLLEEIKKIPKKEHHIHLDGSVFPYILEQITDKDSAKYIESLYFTDINQKVESLEKFLEPFIEINKLLQTEENLFILARELVKYFKDENIVEVDVRFNPYLHTFQGLTNFEVLKSVIEGFEEGRKKYNFDTKIGLIIGVDRGLSPEETKKITNNYIEAISELFDRNYFNYKEAILIKGFDINCNEGGKGNSLIKHIEAINIAKMFGLDIIVHAGESIHPEDGKEDITKYVKEAISIGATRIGHGLLVQYDEEVMYDIKEQNIEIEMNLTSNIQTNSIDNINEFPFKKYLDYGIKLSINTDNPAISNVFLSEEIVRYIEELGINKEQIINIIKV